MIEYIESMIKCAAQTIGIYPLSTQKVFSTNGTIAAFGVSNRIQVSFHRSNKAVNGEKLGIQQSASYLSTLNNHMIA